MKKVFEETSLGGLTLKNRLIRSATCEGIALQDGSAEAELQSDLALTQSMGVRSLPSYHIARGGRDVLLLSFALEDFISVIEQL